MQDDAAVHLELCFTGSSQSHRTLAASLAATASLAFKVGPQALQPWQHIAVLRQFDLCLGTGSLCAHGKDVEDERCAVEDLHLQFVFDIPYLFGREFIIENHHTDFAFCLFFGENVLFDFLQFSLAHVCRLVGSCHTLRETLHGDGACGIGEKFQFVKVFLGLGLVLLLGNESYQNGGFRLDFGDYKFFHAQILFLVKILFLVVNNENWSYKYT